MTRNTHSILQLIIILLFPIFSFGQYNFNIDANQDNHPISPYIYGLSHKHYPYAKSTSLNSSRMTTFNWETNISNGGQSWIYTNDYTVPGMLGVSSSDYDTPGSSLHFFQNYCDQNNLYSAMVVPMAGYVAKDNSCQTSSIAPSECWVEVKNNKESDFVFPPDLSDNIVYNDEMIQYMVDQFGLDGIDAYFLDNEPALWYQEYPHLVNLEIDSLNENNISYESLVQKSIDLAKAIKNINPQADVFGPALWGYLAQKNLHYAIDTESFPEFQLFSDYYLDQFRKEEEKLGYDLIDVFDFHWYPQAKDSAGYITSNNVSPSVVQQRIQSPRTLWDPNYVEPSWQNQFGNMQILKTIKTSIHAYNPGKKLSVSEYFYGAPYHISGGIAQADAMGIFGREEVYYASLFWPKWDHTINKDNLDGYIKTAFDLYLNYDNKGSSFGSQSIKATTDNDEQTSIYASLDDNGDMHIIAINKDNDASTARIRIDNFIGSENIEVYSFDENNESIQFENRSIEDLNDFTINIGSMSASHIVIHAESNSTAHINLEDKINILPNPSANNSFRIINNSSLIINSIRIFNSVGKELLIDKTLSNELLFEGISKGCYFVVIEGNNQVVTKKLIIL